MGNILFYPKLVGVLSGRFTWSQSVTVRFMLLNLYFRRKLFLGRREMQGTSINA